MHHPFVEADDALPSVLPPAEEDSVSQSVEIVEPEPLTTGQAILFGLLVLFVIAWILAGIAAFIISVACASKSGSTAEKIIGFLMSIYLGPFFFIYKSYTPTYCR